MTRPGPIPTTCRAAVATTDGIDIREVPVPSELRGGALVAVEGAAVCGSDWGHFTDGSFFERGALILGHENVGRVVAVDDGAPWAVHLGQRVVVEEFVPCGHCSACHDGRIHVCPATDWRRDGSLRYGRTPLQVWPGLWGGFSELLYVHPATALHPLPDHLPTVVASFATPVANALRWLHDVAALRPGESVLIIGPGAHGLGCVLAARLAGAATIGVAGTERDTQRLVDAQRLGADTAATVGPDRSLSAAVGDTFATGADVIIDLTPAAASVLEEAVALAAPAGRIVVAGHKQGAASAIAADTLLGKELSLLGVRGSTRWSMAAGLELLGRCVDRVAGVEALCLPLEATQQGLQIVGRTDEPETSRVIITPAEPW